MARPTVGILGAGFGGLTLANELVRAGSPRPLVTLIDQKPDFAMGLAKLGVLVGRRDVSEGRRPLKSLSGKGIEIVQAEVTAIDPAKRAVSLSGGGERRFDHLVVALGASLDPGATPGFAEGAHDIYTFEGAATAHGALKALERGRVVLLVCGVPFKCPPAPYEAAFLVDDHLRGRRVRGEVEVALYTPEAQPMPILGPAPGAWVADLLKQRDIEYHPGAKVRSVDPKARGVHFEGGPSTSYDLLLGVPIHRAPRVAVEAGMVDASGWVKVDSRTLETPYPEVYAIGDVAATRIPKGLLLPRAGILAEGQAKVVAQRIAATLGGRRAMATFDARGYCFLEVGGGRAAMAEGEFFADPAPRATLEVPSTKWFEEKRRFEADRLKDWF